ncbi:MAG TPA: pyridine nucleotide-disulfide oxidoreductase [Cytophagales bacterium]|nr:pyridine nucleotide-disulfide oxidoreductase [Cytophagales bacterium]HAA22065.1 pyridine nucleotide-disulfide oxidoreductase [Cytophagales bacterium]HAP60813.1 pyridine nucleotide-disulfide oxidoreductase [Cytophagales bacterium]
MKIYDTIIIGGGQAGLSVAYFLRRYKLDYLVLDSEAKAGGSWLHTWDNLQLFSPHSHSTLSGWRMPVGPNPYPGKMEVIDYLQQYEERYAFPIRRPARVNAVSKSGDHFVLETSIGVYYSRTVVSATGSAHHPFIPGYPGNEQFLGEQLHSKNYRRADAFAGKRVLVVGGGNSGAQILAEVSKVAHTQWVTLGEPRFLPDEVDGRFLFVEATRKYLNPGEAKQRPYSLGDIVMLDSVKEARARDVLHARRPFESFTAHGVVWPDGYEEAFDAVIWCTGFKTDLSHLSPLGLMQNGRIPTQHTRSVKEPLLWLVGYGSWTGFASATLYGVGKTARATAQEIDLAMKEMT